MDDTITRIASQDGQAFIEAIKLLDVLVVADDIFVSIHLQSIGKVHICLFLQVTVSVLRFEGYQFSTIFAQPHKIVP